MASPSLAVVYEIVDEGDDHEHDVGDLMVAFKDVMEGDPVFSALVDALILSDERSRGDSLILPQLVRISLFQNESEREESLRQLKPLQRETCLAMCSIVAENSRVQEIIKTTERIADFDDQVFCVGATMMLITHAKPEGGHPDRSVRLSKTRVVGPGGVGRSGPNLLNQGRHTVELPFGVSIAENQALLNALVNCLPEPSNEDPFLVRDYVALVLRQFRYGSKRAADSDVFSGFMNALSEAIEAELQLKSYIVDEMPETRLFAIATEIATVLVLESRKSENHGELLEFDSDELDGRETDHNKQTITGPMLWGSFEIEDGRINNFPWDGCSLRFATYEGSTSFSLVSDYPELNWEDIGFSPFAGSFRLDGDAKHTFPMNERSELQVEVTEGAIEFQVVSIRKEYVNKLDKIRGFTVAREEANATPDPVSREIEKAVMAETSDTFRTVSSLEAIGARLRELRTTEGLNQTEAAARIGIAQGDYSNMERGKGNPTWQSLQAAFAAFDRQLQFSGDVELEGVHLGKPGQAL